MHWGIWCLWCVHDSIQDVSLYAEAAGCGTGCTTIGMERRNRASQTKLSRCKALPVAAPCLTWSPAILSSSLCKFTLILWLDETVNNVSWNSSTGRSLGGVRTGCVHTSQVTKGLIIPLLLFFSWHFSVSFFSSWDYSSFKEHSLPLLQRPVTWNDSHTQACMLLWFHACTHTQVHISMHEWKSYVSTLWLQISSCT